MKSIKKKSILILGSFSKGALEHQYTRGFKNNNWDVKCIDIQEPVNKLKNNNVVNKVAFGLYPNLFLKAINDEAIRIAKREKPTVILVFKGMELWSETIKELKLHCKILCNYNPDHPFNFYSKGAGNKNVKDSIVLYDIYLSYSTSICKQLIDTFKVNSICIPFGYDENIQPVKSSMANITNQLLFIGAWDKEREIKLKNLSDLPIQIFGPSNWKGKINELGKLSYNTQALYEQEYANACLNAKGILNFLRPQNILEQSHNMRTFEVPGYGGLLIAERTEEQSNFFLEDHEAIYFDDALELIDKLKFLSNHPEIIENMKRNALVRAFNSGYDYSSRTKNFISQLNKYID